RAGLLHGHRTSRWCSALGSFAYHRVADDLHPVAGAQTLVAGLPNGTERAVIHPHGDVILNRFLHIFFNLVPGVGATRRARNFGERPAFALADLVADDQARHAACHRAEAGAFALHLDGVDGLHDAAIGAN